MRIQVSPEEKKRLKEVAKQAGMSLSDFLLAAAIKTAHKVLGPPKLVETENN